MEQQGKSILLKFICIILAHLNIWYLEVKFFSVQDILAFLTEDLYFWAIMFHILYIKSELNKFNYNSTFYLLLNRQKLLRNPWMKKKQQKKKKKNLMMKLQ